MIKFNLTGLDLESIGAQAEDIFGGRYVTFSDLTLRLVFFCRTLFE